MTHTALDYQRMGIWRLGELARASHEEHDPEAARVFVARILDMEVERRTLFEHGNQGWHTVSPLATIGEPRGGSTETREPLATLYDRGIYTHDQHESARRWIDAARLPPRQLLAALIRARKLHPRQQYQGNEWTKGYDYIAAHLDRYAKTLGLIAVPGRRSRMVVRKISPQHRNALHTWPQPAERVETELARMEAAAQVRQVEQQVHDVVPVFKNGAAIRDADKTARVTLILQAKYG